MATGKDPRQSGKDPRASLSLGKDPRASAQLVKPASPAAAGAPKPKKRKYRGSPLTPRQRMILLIAAVACIPLAFILPKTNWGPEDEPEPPKTTEDGKEVFAPPPPEAHVISEGYVRPAPKQVAQPKPKAGKQ
jgi:hypothetical protein